MSMASDTSEQDIYDELPTDWWAVGRLVSGWLITLAALPLGLGYVLAFWVLEGRYPSAIYWFGPAILAVLVLTWGLGRNPTIKPFNSIVLGTLLVGWIVASVILGSILTTAERDHGWLIALYAGATLWMPWLAWFGYWPASFFSKLSVLVVLVASLLGFHQIVEVPGLFGSSLLSLQWRGTSEENTLTATAEESAVALDLTETPYDFAQYLGPSRDAVVRGIELEADWKARPPEVLWRQPIGKGWGAFTAVGDYAFTQEQRGQDECVVCYELRTGKEMWRHSDRTAFLSNFGGDGPRATPAVDKGLVFTAGATGIVNAINGATGKRLWTYSLIKGSQENLPHGVCASPLVVGNLVYVCPVTNEDESLVALDKNTGSVVFSAGGGRASYASPIAVDIAGTLQILAYKTDRIVGHDPLTGAVLWSHPWTNNQATNAAQPIVYRDEKENVFVSTAYSKGSTMFGVAKDDKGAWTTTTRWVSRDMKNKFATSILMGDYIVGLDDGILAGLDMAGGRKLWKWKLGRYGHGQILAVGRRIIALTESGDLVLIEPNRKEPIELARLAEAIHGKTWNHLAFSPPFLLIRNADEAACLRIPIEGDAEAESADPMPPSSPKEDLLNPMPQAPKKSIFDTPPAPTKPSAPAATKPSPSAPSANLPKPSADAPFLPSIKPPVNLPPKPSTDPLEDLPLPPPPTP